MSWRATGRSIGSGRCSRSPGGTPPFAKGGEGGSEHRLSLVRKSKANRCIPEIESSKRNEEFHLVPLFVAPPATADTYKKVRTCPSESNAYHTPGSAQSTR